MRAVIAQPAGDGEDGPIDLRLGYRGGAQIPAQRQGRGKGHAREDACGARGRIDPQDDPRG
jgi:hypothetical protein